MQLHPFCDQTNRGMRALSRNGAGTPCNLLVNVMHAQVWAYDTLALSRCRLTFSIAHAMASSNLLDACPCNQTNTPFVNTLTAANRTWALLANLPLLLYGRAAVCWTCKRISRLRHCGAASLLS